jgi:hypothetical protein
MATTTNYSWDTPDNTDYVKDGAQAIRTLGSSVDTTLYTALGGTYPGLRLVKKQTIGAGVASVSVTSAFSATYENYKIIVSGGTSSANGYLTLALNGSTTGYSMFMVYGNVTTNTVQGAGIVNTSRWEYAGGMLASNSVYLNCDIMTPFTTQHARISSLSAAQYGLDQTGTATGYHTVASSFSGFTITPGTGTLTGGTIYVYGYGTS